MFFTMFLFGRKFFITPKISYAACSYWAEKFLLGLKVLIGRALIGRTPLYLSRAFFLFGSKRYPLGHRHFLPSCTNGSKQLFGDIYSIFRENDIFTQIKNLVRKLLKKSWSSRESSRISGIYLNMSIFGAFRSTGK